jgi:hypothetical protein
MWKRIERGTTATIHHAQLLSKGPDVVKEIDANIKDDKQFSAQTVTRLTPNRPNILYVS